MPDNFLQKQNKRTLLIESKKGTKPAQYFHSMLLLKIIAYTYRFDLFKTRKFPEEYTINT